MLLFESLEKKDPVLAFQLRCTHQKKEVLFLDPVKSDKELLIFDGIDWLYSHEANRGRWIIFIEEDLEKIRAVLNNPRFLDLVQDERAAIVHRGVFPFPIGGKVFETFGHSYSKLLMKFVQEVICFDALYAEGLDRGLSHFKNVFDSLLTLPKVFLLSTLKGDFCRPWLIVGGAELSDEENLFVQQAQHTHWICSSGSATKKLLRRGIRPDFATFVDPDPNLEDYVQNNIPTFFQLRGKTDYLKSLTGPLIWAGENGLYPLEKSLCEIAGLDEHILEGGYDSFNIAVAIATYFKAKTIESIGFSSGRGTMNDLLSRVHLENYDLIPHRLNFDAKRIVKNWSGEQVELNHGAVMAFCQKIVGAEDQIDYDRLGLIDGYLKKIHFFVGKEDVDLSVLVNMVEKLVVQHKQFKEKK